MKSVTAGHEIESEKWIACTPPAGQEIESETVFSANDSDSDT